MKIYSPSYKRANLCTTHKYLKEVIYVVRESEADDYKKVHDKLWIVPDSAQGNVSKIRNYILDHSDTDIFVTMDDDIKYFGRWNGNKSKKLSEQEVYNMIQEGNQLAEDLDVRLWGLNLMADKGAFREYTPFGTTQVILGPFQGHRNNDLRYDQKIFLKEDYDMSIQMLLEDRKTLRMNMYHYVCDQNKMRGGCAESRNIEVEKHHLDMLQKKWGSKIVRFDTTNKSGKQKKFDINPVIKIPIKGV
jgi:hypothetical protein